MNRMGPRPSWPLEGYRLEVELISPVHVGTGEAYPAYAYIPDFQKGVVHLIDTSELLLRLPEDRQKELVDKVAQGPKGAQEALRYLYGEGRVPPEVIRRTLGASKAFLEAVKEATMESLLEFRPLPYSPLGPYLPGSSVKGALRTAWLYHTLVERGQDVVYREGRWVFRKASGDPLIYPPKEVNLKVNQNFEATVLGYLKEGSSKPDLYADPFRAVRLTDSSPGEGFLNRIGIFHPKGTTEGMIVLAETFRKGSRFHFLFRYQPGLAEHKGVAGAIPPEKLVQALREYYSHVAQWEEAIAQDHGLQRALEVYGELKKRLEDPSVFPLRVGFGSGRLALRLALLLPEDYPEAQEPKTRKTVGAKKPKDGYPLGWAVGRLVPLGKG